MSTLSSTLQIAKSALAAQQQAMNVTAHNIANASTDGYTRQRALMESGPAIHLTYGVFGSGVRIEDVQRVGDVLLDGAYYRELSGSVGQETRASILGRVEGVLGEPSDLGLAAALDAFHSAWSELASNPGSATLRSAVRQSAVTLTSTFGRISESLQTLRQEIEARLDTGAAEATRLSAEISQLNRQITVVESDGSTAGDLRDERGRRLNELAELLPIHVVERENGSVGVTTSGISIVDGVVSQVIEAGVSGGIVGVTVAGRAGFLTESGGSLDALADLLNSGLPAVQGGLDDLAAALVTEVNAVHVTGTNPTGTAGVDFFDAAGLTAASIAVSSQVLSSPDQITAGTPDGGGAYRAGTNDIALALAGLRDTDSASLGMPFVEHYRGLVFDLGQDVRSSADSADVYRALSHQAAVRREELGGVSIDEELVKMIEFQTAYQAAARIITAVDEMLHTLVTI